MHECCENFSRVPVGSDQNPKAGLERPELPTRCMVKDILSLCVRTVCVSVRARDLFRTD